MKELLILLGIVMVAIYVASWLLCKFTSDSERKIDDESSEPRY